MIKFITIIQPLGNNIHMYWHFYQKSVGYRIIGVESFHWQTQYVVYILVIIIYKIVRILNCDTIFKSYISTVNMVHRWSRTNRVQLTEVPSLFKLATCHCLKKPAVSYFPVENFRWSRDNILVKMCVLLPNYCLLFRRLLFLPSWSSLWPFDREQS